MRPIRPSPLQALMCHIFRLLRTGSFRIATQIRRAQAPSFRDLRNATRGRATTANDNVKVVPDERR